MNTPDFSRLDVNTVPLDGCSLIEASAGTGKTWTITGLYTRLIVEKQLTVEQILVVTYTKAATAELRGRIRGRLVECLRVLQGQPGDVFSEGLRAALVDEEQRQQACKRLTRAIQGFDEAAVFTIHGYCQRVLADSAFESGMDFDLELMPDTGSLLRAILADCWREQSARAEGLWADYLQRQQQTPGVWLQILKSHLGKPYQQVLPLPELPDSSVLEQQFERCFFELCDCWQRQQAEIRECLADISALNKRSYDRNKVDALLNYLGDVLRCGVPVRLGDVALLGQGKLEKGSKKNCTPPRHLFFEAVDAILQVQEQLDQLFEQRLAKLRVELLQRCDEEMIRRKQQQRLLSYDDMLNRLADALDGGNGDQLAAQLAGCYPAALVDEFQDTDPVQYRIFRRIYQRGEGSLFMVGDPKQAIYSFRGADLFSYLTAREAASAHYTLDVNQRSVPALIDVLNDLFQPAGLARPFVTEQIRYWPVAPSERGKGELQVEDDAAAALQFLTWSTATAGDKPAPASKQQCNRLAANGTAEEIVRLLGAAANGKATIASGENRRPLCGGDVAVLVASHRQGQLIQEALSARGVPSVRQGQDNVFASAEAGELLQILLAIAEPARQSSLRTALVTLLWKGDGLQLQQLQADEVAWESLQEQVRELHQLWQTRGFMAMFRRWLAEFDIVPRLLGMQGGERRVTNLLHLAELLQMESGRLRALEQLLAWFSRSVSETGDGHDEARQLRLESDASRVRIVTIHTSKGLEYPVVFCPFLWDGAIRIKKQVFIPFHDPAQDFQACLDGGSEQREASLAVAEQEALAERLRLLYVALTRARYRCYILWGQCGDKDKSQATAALSWLLYGQDQLLAGDNPVEAIRQQLSAGMDDEAFFLPLRELAARNGQKVDIRPADDGLNLLQESSTPEGVPRQLAPQQLARGALVARWRMTSFSGLSAGRASERPDHDSSDRSGEELLVEDDDFFTFPRGAGPGNCLHAIFEEWDFVSDDDSALLDLVRRRLKVAAIDEHWAGIVSEQVRVVLQHPLLPDSNLRMADLAAAQRRPEMEFTFQLADLRLEALQQLLADERAGLPGEFVSRLEHLSFSRVNGYMKGFIDLVFEHQGRFYLLDYKSNWLGNRYTHYHQQAMLDAMAHAHYYLQYLIYSVALHRYLALRVPDYDPEQHFGGVYYLFLRGIQPDPESDSGIFFHRPGQWLLTALGELFDQGGMHG